MRILFAGTPEAAVPSLQSLLASDHEVVGVLTRPDAPTGRGRRLTPSPVRRCAEDAGVPVLTPSSLRGPEAQQALRELRPDVAAVVAYGSLVPPDALVIPAHGWINLHFSLLPQWRGAAPVQRAILAGQHRTGMTTFRLDAGLDTGDVLETRESPIGERETAGELLERLAGEGADLLRHSLDAIAAGTARFTPQPTEGVSHAAKLTATEARIDWAQPSAAVGAHIRGMSPAPGAWTEREGVRIKVLGIEAPPAGEVPSLRPGELHATRRALLVGTGDAPIALGTIAAPGRRAMSAVDWARGAGLQPGEAFTAPGETTTQNGEVR